MASEQPVIAPPVEVLARDLAWPEGPTALRDGTIAFVESDRGRVSALSPAGELRAFAVTGGRPNGTAAGVDGCLYVAQSGPAAPGSGIPDAPPGVQRVTPDGGVRTVAGECDGRPLIRPNDIVLGPGGRLYFTDPGRWDPDERPDPGAIHVLDRDGGVRLVRDVGNVYPNGLGLDPGGRLVWAESYTRRVMALRADGGVDVVHAYDDPRRVPDGLCFLPSGHLVVALTASASLGVLAPDGTSAVVELGAVPTNCAVVGDWLYVTDGGQVRVAGEAQAGGSLWRVRRDRASA